MTIATVTSPLDYQRLLLLVEFDDMLVICKTCGAWLDRDDPATATMDDYNGCWKVAAGEDSDRCKSYRAAPRR